MSSGRPPFYRTKLFNLSLGIAVSIFFLWLALRDILQDEDALANIGRAFRQANYWSLPFMLAVLFIFYWLKSIRWRILLRPIGDFKPMRELFPPVLIGFAFNNVLPAHLGEFVRCFVFSRQHRVPVSVSVATVVLERVFDIIAIVSFLAIGLLFVEGVDPKVQQSAYVFAAAAACCVLGGLIYVIWTKPFVRLVEGILLKLPFIPHGLRDKVCELLETGAKGLSALKSVPLMLQIVANSLVQWLLNGSLVLMSLWSFGIEVPFPVALVVLGVVAFGVTIPSSPGYFGVIQACFVLVLKLFVEDQESIFAASVYFHLSQYIPVTLLGLFFFSRTGLSVSQVEEAEEEFEEEVATHPHGPEVLDAEPIGKE